jgi:hypothetical protein
MGIAKPKVDFKVYILIGIFGNNFKKKNQPRNYEI